LLIFDKDDTTDAASSASQLVLGTAALPEARRAILLVNPRIGDFGGERLPIIRLMRCEGDRDAAELHVLGSVMDPLQVDGVLGVMGTCIFFFCFRGDTSLLAKASMELCSSCAVFWKRGSSGATEAAPFAEGRLLGAPPAVPRIELRRARAAGVAELDRLRGDPSPTVLSLLPLRLFLATEGDT